MKSMHTMNLPETRWFSQRDNFNHLIFTLNSQTHITGLALVAQWDMNSLMVETMIFQHTKPTSGFDNQGRLFDGEGRLNDWWGPDTNEEFEKRVQCVIDQYNKFQVLPGIYVNGKLTQGENIADIGGIKNTFRAYKYKKNSTLALIIPSGKLLVTN